MPEIGDYVFATKYSDGDPGDPWAVGFYHGTTTHGRHRVGHETLTPDAPNGFRFSGYGYVRGGLRLVVGDWLVEHCKILEKAPPGAVNLWTMLTPSAFGVEEGAPTGDAGEDKTP